LDIPMKPLLTTALLFIVLVATGQTDSVQSLQKDSLYTTQKLPFLQPRLSLIGKTIRPRDAKDIFNAVPASIPHYKKYKNRFSIGLVSACVTAVTAVMIEFPKK